MDAGGVSLIVSIVACCINRMTALRDGERFLSMLSYVIAACGVVAFVVFYG